MFQTADQGVHRERKRERGQKDRQSHDEISITEFDEMASETGLSRHSVAFVCFFFVCSTAVGMSLLLCAGEDGWMDDRMRSRE